MKTISAPHRGFSLIEVSITLAVVAFALVGIMGVLPVAMQNTRTCVDETRAAQLARLVFNTLQSEPFTAARCFSPDNSTIDLSTRTEPAVLYASYDVRDTVKLVRQVAPPPLSEYVLTLSFEKSAVASSTGATLPGATPPPTPPPRGTMVRLTIRPRQDLARTVYLGGQFIGRLRQAPDVTSTPAPTTK